MRSNPVLWRKLQAFQVEDRIRTGEPFEQRLARERGWSLEFAHRAIDEYRKFLYLAAISDHPIIPSPAVDAVWALHLTQTRSYWDELCRGNLARPLHRESRADGSDRGLQETLALYRAEFGSEPPGRIWGRRDVPEARCQCSDGGGHREPIRKIGSMALAALCGEGEPQTRPSLAAMGVLLAVALLCAVVRRREWALLEDGSGG